MGGELVPSMLDLRLDRDRPASMPRPLQMKANNGIFIIDDFGRQLMSPRDLLNRWIVPLDRRVDYLMLRYGVKFQIPFETDGRVFDEPRSLGSWPTKLSCAAFTTRSLSTRWTRRPSTRSSRAWSRSKRIPTEPDSAAFLRSLCLRDGRTELRACYPADICNILFSIGKYEGQPPRMSKPEMARAAALYFAKS